MPRQTRLDAPRKTLAFMEFIPGLGLCPDPCLGLPEKGLPTLYRGFAAKVAGYEFLDAFLYYGINGCLPSKRQSPGLLEEFFIDVKRNSGHFGAPDERSKQKIAQAL
jgi:hypothetical protein